MSDTEFRDDDLERFAAVGAATLPAANEQGYVEHDNARIWYATFGTGSPVILLHGGNGHSGNWGYQVPGLIGNGFRPVLIDSRGHGRSTRDELPFTYQRMAADVLAVMDQLDIQTAAFIGWSDGAVIALTIAMKAPEHVSGVFFFACNVDANGAKKIAELSPILQRCLGRHAMDYAQLSATPDDFTAFHQALSVMMTTQPNYTATDLEQVRVRSRSFTASTMSSSHASTQTILPAPSHTQNTCILLESVTLLRYKDPLYSTRRCSPFFANSSSRLMLGPHMSRIYYHCRR